MNILNIITQLLSYADPCVTDNPQLRNIDWTRKISGVVIDKPESDVESLAPGESLTVFDGTRSTQLADTTSVLQIALAASGQSRYRVTVTSGPAGFRTARAVSGITGAMVTVNNNATASFAFSGATLTGVVVGDIMRISGLVLFDSGSFAFSPSNAGLWKVISVSGSTVQAVRLAGQSFNGVSETVATATNDVQFYSSAGVQVGDTVLVTGTFAEPTQRAYEVQDVTPTSFDIVSVLPLPLESGLAYTDGTITFYPSCKKLVYIEVDQEAVVRFNDDVSDNNRLVPVLVGTQQQGAPGFLHKYGDTYRIVVVNKSINTMQVRYFLAE